MNFNKCWEPYHTFSKKSRSYRDTDYTDIMKIQVQLVLMLFGKKYGIFYRQEENSLFINQLVLQINFGVKVLKRMWSQQ